MGWRRMRPSMSPLKEYIKFKPFHSALTVLWMSPKLDLVCIHVPNAIQIILVANNYNRALEEDERE